MSKKSKKASAGKTLIAPVAVGLIVLAVQRGIEQGAVVDGAIFAGIGVALFGGYHLLDEKYVQELIPGDAEEDVQRFLENISEDELVELGEHISDAVMRSQQASSTDEGDAADASSQMFGGGGGNPRWERGN